MVVLATFLPSANLHAAIDNTQSHYAFPDVPTVYLQALAMYSRIHAGACTGCR
jgi:hypothetical protein